jgi:pimeloyl-ACP methyl ester carboxylesterase
VTRHGRIALLLGLLACKTPARTSPSTSPRTSESESESESAKDANAHGASTKLDARAPSDDASRDASADAPEPSREPRGAIGPFEVPFEGARKVFYVTPRTAGRARLIANLHGVCNPPGYACGFWVPAASNEGFLVCPEGNSHCGGASGPPTWTEPVASVDADLEKAIAVVSAKHPGEVSREGAVLTGFSLGAYSAALIARKHPGRWPYLVLIEANVPLDAAQLRAAGVRAVALLAGEKGSQLAGERRTAEQLAKQGFPARLWIMKGAGHHYSPDIDALMAEAFAFVLADGGPDFTPDAGEADAAR